MPALENPITLYMPAAIPYDSDITIVKPVILDKDIITINCCHNNRIELEEYPGEQLLITDCSTSGDKCTGSVNVVIKNCPDLKKLDIPVCVRGETNIVIENCPALTELCLKCSASAPAEIILPRVSISSVSGAFTAKADSVMRKVIGNVNTFAGYPLADV